MTNLPDSPNQPDDAAAPLAGIAAGSAGPAGPAGPGQGRRSNSGIAFDRLLRRLGIMTAVLAVVGGAVSYALAGWPGLWGALIGALVVGVFMGTTALVMLVTARRTLPAQSMALMAAWSVKTLILIGVVIALGKATFLTPMAFGATVIGGVLGSLVLELQAAWTTRVTLETPPRP